MLLQSTPGLMTRNLHNVHMGHIQPHSNLKKTSSKIEQYLYQMKSLPITESYLTSPSRKRLWRKVLKAITPAPVYLTLATSLDSASRRLAWRKTSFLTQKPRKLGGLSSLMNRVMDILRSLRQSKGAILYYQNQTTPLASKQKAVDSISIVQ